MDKTCQKCGAVYSVKGTFRKEHSKFCSRRCQRLGQVSHMKGKMASLETRQKQRDAKLGRTGELCPNYRGIGKANKLERERFSHQLRETIFQRDGYTCQICKHRGGVLHVDHIKRWSEYPELRFEASNCRTLCRPCHYHVTFKKELPENSSWGLIFSGRIASSG